MTAFSEPATKFLGSMFDGVDFERAVAKILDECRTEEEITKAFDALQEMLNFKREQGIEQGKTACFGKFESDVAGKAPCNSDTC